MLHKARETFTANENSEKMGHVLLYNIIHWGAIKYFIGDSVHNKQMNSKEWHGPAKVLEQHGQQVLVKHESNFIRVHPYHLQLIHKNSNYSQVSASQVHNLNNDKKPQNIPNSHNCR